MSPDEPPIALARISQDVLDRDSLERLVWSKASGALVTFSGIVRDHDEGRAVLKLEYLAHPEAERFLQACCDRVTEATGLRMAAAHRVGVLEIGDVALVASVAAAHRQAAFEACAELVEQIKTSVPIWKRQHFADGRSEWVGL